ncbi:hypothetical protein [Burkholderia arboris]|uniref:hypothetical protein n=1 Tax=Burkholderia arboris TaxID=488730 RepID=UPI0012D90D60|nr:hypothetical protein [Burkholderia arboris]MCA8494570.1 hypothetical protein [Burkholderia arboris]
MRKNVNICVMKMNDWMWRDGTPGNEARRLSGGGATDALRQAESVPAQARLPGGVAVIRFCFERIFCDFRVFFPLPRRVECRDSPTFGSGGEGGTPGDVHAESTHLSHGFSSKFDPRD